MHGPQGRSVDAHVLPAVGANCRAQRPELPAVLYTCLSVRSAKPTDALHCLCTAPLTEDRLCGTEIRWGFVQPRKLQAMDADAAVPYTKALKCFATTVGSCAREDPAEPSGDLTESSLKKGGNSGKQPAEATIGDHLSRQLPLQVHNQLHMRRFVLHMHAGPSAALIEPSTGL